MKSSKHILAGSNRAIRMIAFLVMALVMVATYVPFDLVHASVSGTLDPTFAGGRATTDFFGSYDDATAMAVQADGKIVAAGIARSSSGVDAFALARYNTDGSLDSSFGTGGKLTTQFRGGPLNPDWAFCVLIQADGKIVTAGRTSFQNTSDFALARYNSDGSLDPTFGSGGKVMSDFRGSIDEVHGIAQQADGKLIVAGASYPDAIVARYNLDGTLDSSFGTGGRVITHLADKTLIPVSMQLQPDGKIVWLGWVYGDDDADLFIARYNPNGTLDSGFGSGGEVITDVSGHHDEAYGLALQPDGRIVVVGRWYEVGVYLNKSTVVRYNTDGTLDATFGTGGKVTLDTLYNGAYLAVAIQPDDKIVLGGSFFHLARLNPDGTLDLSFGTNGRSTETLSGAIGALALQPDGRIIGTGSSFNASNTTDFAVARFDVVTTNRTPVANAGPDQDVECGGNPTTVVLDGTGSSDPDNDSLTYEWREGSTLLGNGATLSTTLAPGSHTVTLIVTDPSGVSAPDTVVIKIADTNPPGINAPANVTANTGSSASCSVYLSDATLGTATATDLCSGSAVTVTRTGVPANNEFPIGTTTITYKATDASGNSATAQQSVTVVDNSAPTIAGASVDQPFLWPPNHQMVEVNISYEIVDNCSGVAGVTSSLSVTSNEPVTGTSDGDVGPDWEIVSPHVVRLRAERAGSGTGRVYTITITSQDSNGNSNSASVTVAVPRSQSQSGGSR
jgi:uncharacterized delta-60 repeat protein